VELIGDERAAALAAFSNGAAGVRVDDGQDVSSHIAQGRKATKSKEFTKAVEHFNAAIALDPTAARAWSGWGYARQLAGEWTAAEADFTKALELDSTPAFQGAVWFNLGGVHEGRGDRAAARRAYDKANTLSPSEAAQKKLETLQ
jgi:Flp pilus assembly protein TadD